MTRRTPGWLLAATATLALIPMGSSAQTPPPSAPPLTAGVPGLTLTPAEQARANTRVQQFNQQAQAVANDPKLSVAQKRAKIQGMAKVMDADMLSYLTPSQRALVLKQRAQQKAKAAAFQKAHKTDISEGQTLAARLNQSLTADQKKQIAAASGPYNAQLQQVAKDPSLTPAAKQARMRSAQQELVSKIKAVLTPAQRSDYEKMLDIQQRLAKDAATGMSHP